ncbi:DUF6563 family protein [Bacteroides sp.]
MKKLFFVLLLSLVGVAEVAAQNIVYSNLKDFLANDGDTVAVLKVEKRTKNNILMTGGADYKISAGSDDHPLCKYLKKRCYAVQADTSLYVNCKRLRYKKFRFGAWYAPALLVNGTIYFSAIPLGSVAAGSDATMDVMLGGTFGDAIAASALISKRVYYEIDPQTGKVDFVGKDKMLSLLSDYPDWQKAYIDENSESAKVTGKYLMKLCSSGNSSH